MRELVPPPSTLRLSAPSAYGSFRGPLPPVVADLGLLARRTRHKRWFYALVVDGEQSWAVGIVDLGYAGQLFVHGVERATGRCLANLARVAPPSCVRVGQGPRDPEVARFSFAGARAEARAGRGGMLALDLDWGGARLRWEGLCGATPPIAAITRLDGGGASATEKGVLWSVKGSTRVDGATHDLDGATAGYDYSSGVMARRTAWRWAFGLGKTRDGRQFGFNVVDGFVGERECAAFVDDCVWPLPEAHIAYSDGGDGAWSASSSDMELEFATQSLHAQHTNLGLVRAHFLQPMGTWTGRVRVDGQWHDVEAYGVAEDQDVTW